MICNFEDAFMPSEEKKKLFEQTVRKVQIRAIEKKECWMCANTYLEPWNNHGHEDYTRQCAYTKECVDFENNGEKCPHWKARNID